tara:strand:- start:40553 stop:40771 length:219 start_codon:yes stop_codon:yes gene_type:complete
MLKENALKYFGTQVVLAKALGIKQQAVSKWGLVIPWGAALELQVITGGLIQRDESLYENRKPKHVDPETLDR